MEESPGSNRSMPRMMRKALGLAEAILGRLPEASAYGGVMLLPAVQRAPKASHAPRPGKEFVKGDGGM